VVKVLIVIMVGLVLLSGCGSFWEDQGTASRTSAEARLRQAEAERQNAQPQLVVTEPLLTFCWPSHISEPPRLGMISYAVL